MPSNSQSSFAIGRQRSWGLLTCPAGPMSAQPTILQTYSLVDAVQMISFNQHYGKEVLHGQQTIHSGLGGVPQALQETMLSQPQLWTAMFRICSLTRAVSKTWLTSRASSPMNASFAQLPISWDSFPTWSKPLVGHVGHTTVRQSLIWKFQFPQLQNYPKQNW